MTDRKLCPESDEHRWSAPMPNGARMCVYCGDLDAAPAPAAEPYPHAGMLDSDFAAAEPPRKPCTLHQCAFCQEWWDSAAEPPQDMAGLIARLRKRAEIRRSIPRGEPDRISDILEEAAAALAAMQADRAKDAQAMDALIAGARKDADALAAMARERDELRADIGRRASSELATYADTSALALQYLERAEQAERDLAEARAIVDAAIAWDAVEYGANCPTWKQQGDAAQALHAAIDAARKNAPDRS